MLFSSREHGIFSTNVDCDAASECQNTRCLYKQKTLGVHIWYIGDGPYEGVDAEKLAVDKKNQLELRETLGPWYQPELTALKGTNCHTIWCRDYVPSKK